MNKFTSASYPFIAQYDSENKRKEMDKKNISGSARAKNHTESHESRKRRSNHIKHEGSHRDKRQHLKGNKMCVCVHAHACMISLNILCCLLKLF